MTESQMLIDVYDLILQWAKAYPLSKDLKNKVDWNNFGPANVNLENLKIRHSTTEHSIEEDPQAGIPKPNSYVLFSSIFTNDTDQPQTYSLRTERRTNSTTRISISKGITFGHNISVNLTPPNPVLTANAGFKRDVTFQKTGESTTTEELVWTLDSQIQVPANKKTRAELVIEEQEYEGTFRVDTILEGKITVILKEEKTGAKLAPMYVNDIRTVFRTEDGFEHTGRSQVKFVTVGQCKCRYGIQQRVDLHQMSLNEENGIN